MKEEFAKDFVEAQYELQTLPKDKEGYGYKYTDFDTVVTTVKPILKKHNLGFIQLLETINGKSGVRTILIHTSGEQLDAWFELPSIVLGKANNAQNIGGAISYVKRYALCSLLGCSSDEDIDCNIPDDTVEIDGLIRVIRSKENGFTEEQKKWAEKAIRERNKKDLQLIVSKIV